MYSCLYNLPGIHRQHIFLERTHSFLKMTIFPDTNNLLSKRYLRVTVPAMKTRTKEKRVKKKIAANRVEYIFIMCNINIYIQYPKESVSRNHRPPPRAR